MGYELARDKQVIILEAESQPGYHTSGRSAAFYAESYGNKVVRAITTASKSFFLSPPDGFCDQDILSQSGAMHIARKDQLESLESLFQELSQGNASIFREDAKFAQERCSGLRPDYVSGCVWDPESSVIDVHTLLHGYLRGFKNRGGQIDLENRVSRLEYSGSVWVAQTAMGEFSAPIVINASGAWADKVAEMADLAGVGMSPMRRTVCMVEPGEVDISAWPLVIDADEDFYFKPDAGRLLLSPADETPFEPCDVWPDDLDVALAVERLEKATNIRVEQKIRNQWAGLRSFAPDRTPVVGYDANANGFFWLAGQGGYGMQTAPALSQSAAALVLGNELPGFVQDQGVDATDLHPNRLTESNTQERVL